MKAFSLLLLLLSQSTSALRYDEKLSQWNLNENQTANNVLDYWGRWPEHVYHPSPSNWRFPFYTLFLDRFVDGDPENNDINGTVFETDTFSNQYRFGGDLVGLTETLDYIQGIGIKVSCSFLSQRGKDLTVDVFFREFISPAPPSRTFRGNQIVIQYAEQP